MKMKMWIFASTSDHQHHPPDVFGFLWIFDGVVPLVSLHHRIDDQVAAVAVDTSPTAGHNSALHQHRVPQPGSRPVPKGDLHLLGGQHDVKVLPVEQGHRFFYGWIFRRNREGVQIFKGLERFHNLYLMSARIMQESGMWEVLPRTGAENAANEEEKLGLKL